jgi:hypothetical protein
LEPKVPEDIYKSHLENHRKKKKKKKKMKKREEIWPLLTSLLTAM